MITTAKTAGVDLNNFMEKNGKTLEEIFLKTGISISTLIKIRKGKVNPQSRTVYKLNNYFKNF